MKRNNMENATETKTSERIKPTNSRAPLRKKSKNSPKAKTNESNIEVDEVKLTLLASDGRIPEQNVSLMASKMIDTVLQNNESSHSAPNCSSSSTGKKKSKPTLLKKAKSKLESSGKAAVNRPSVEKLASLADCLQCQWPYNYHPCLLSNSKDNMRCREEMEQKGFHYEEPKQYCLDQSKVNDTPTNANSQATCTASSKKLKPNLNSKTPSIKSVKKIGSKLNEAKSQLNTKKSDHTDGCKEIGTASSHTRFIDNSQDLQKSLDHMKRPKSQKRLKSAMSLPASVRESRARFNVQEPSPSTINLPPETMPADELKCKNFDPETSECCEIASKVTVSQTIKPCNSKVKKLKQVVEPKETKEIIQCRSAPGEKKANEDTATKSTKSTVDDCNLGEATSPKQTKSTIVRKETNAVLNCTKRSKSKPTVDKKENEVKQSGINIKATLSDKKASNVKRPKSTKSVVVADKKLDDYNELVAMGKYAACDWRENYHPCDGCDDSEKKCGDKQACYQWKTINSDAETLAGDKASCKSILEIDSTVSDLTTTESEKAYIDDVVRTAVKLAKKTMIGDKKKKRKKSKNKFESGMDNSAYEDTVGDGGVSPSLTQMQESTIVNNAIDEASTTQKRPVKQKKSKKNNLATEWNEM